MSPTRLTDKLDVVALDATDYPDEHCQKVTCVKSALLQQAMDVLDDLGWDHVDISMVEPSDDAPATQPLLVIEPPSDSVMGGDQAGIVVAGYNTDDTVVGGSHE